MSRAARGTARRPRLLAHRHRWHGRSQRPYDRAVRSEHGRGSQPRPSRTASVATTSHPMPPGEPSRVTSSGTGTSSCPNWPRRRQGPVTWRWPGSHSSGCPQRTPVTPSEGALGMEARLRALLSDGEVADRCDRESIDRLGRTRVRVGPRPSASALRAVAAPSAPPPRGARAATHRPRHARPSNPEIGALLFNTARTVKYRLRKVFRQARDQLAPNSTGCCPATRPPPSPGSPPSAGISHTSCPPARGLLNRIGELRSIRRSVRRVPRR